MPQNPRRSSRSQTVYCPKCREQFLTYNTVATTECPFCHRAVRPVGQRRLLGFFAFLLLAGLVAAGAVFFWLQR